MFIDIALGAAIFGWGMRTSGLSGRFDIPVIIVAGAFVYMTVTSLLSAGDMMIMARPEGWIISGIVAILGHVIFAVGYWIGSRRRGPLEPEQADEIFN